MPALPEPLPNERYVAVYDYTSDEAGDLHFSAGQVIRVVKKTSEWWTGQFGANIGVFPYNFVEPEGGVSFEKKKEFLIHSIRGLFLSHRLLLPMERLRRPLRPLPPSPRTLIRLRPSQRKRCRPRRRCKRRSR